MSTEMYGALILSCSSFEPNELVKLILDTEELPDPVRINEIALAYPWSIETKYYTSDINLFTITHKDLVSESFADAVQAVVIHFDSSKSNSLETVSSWLPFFEHFSPDVQILVCHNCTNKCVPKHDVLDWCLKNQFELVELFPDELSDTEEEDDFKETTGCKRIVQALHAHMWPNMKMIENPNIHNSAKLQELLNSENSSSCEQDLTAGDLQSATSGPNENGIDALLDENREIFESMNLEDPESFEGLFSVFQDMKERASTLHGEERKKYAEKVAIAFWKAMGGEEDEIAGLSDEET